MVKKILLGMFLAVVAMATTTEAAVMNFRGNFGGAGSHVGNFTLDFDVVEPGTVSGFDRIGQITNVRLVTSAGLQTFVTGTATFTNKDTFVANETLAFDLTFTSGQIGFAYSQGPTNVLASNALTRANMYDFMFKVGVASPAGPAYSRANNFVVVSGFGGATPNFIESVPEPGSMAALAFLTSGIAGFAYRRRKAKAKK